jgi:hypothetical protein
MREAKPPANATAAVVFITPSMKSRRLMGRSMPSSRSSLFTPTFLDNNRQQ